MSAEAGFRSSFLFRSPPAQEYDLAIIGAGLAGMAAALFASHHGMNTVQIGNGGTLFFASGLLDLMGVHPVQERRIWDDPWAALCQVARDIPEHPCVRIPPDDLRVSFSVFVSALEEVGLSYSHPGERNLRVPTSLGTVKVSYCVPLSMMPAAEALRKGKDCLLVGFPGLREYSARQIAENLSPAWPGLRSITVELDEEGTTGELTTTHLARRLELPEYRIVLVRLVRPFLGTVASVGFPAVLGIRRTKEILQDLTNALGVSVFEIPTIPTSVPGLRLKDALERAVAERKIHRIVQRRVARVERDDTLFYVSLAGEPRDSVPIRARALILATGRFMGGGLVGDRATIREPLLGIPVRQPKARSFWFRQDLFDGEGHPIDVAGVEVDNWFRPVDEQGHILHPRLFAIGSLLAHADWIRMKCGASLALGSAWRAVSRAKEVLKEGA